MDFGALLLAWPPDGTASELTFSAENSSTTVVRTMFFRGKTCSVSVQPTSVIVSEEGLPMSGRRPPLIRHREPQLKRSDPC